MKRDCLIATASGCGKTTTGRMLAPIAATDEPVGRFPVARLRSTPEVDDLLRRAERAA